MQGVCADCWAPKDEHARTFRRAPRTEPVFQFDFDWTDDFDLRIGVGALLVLISVLVRLVA